jgi:hypothetical protein
VRIVLGKAAVLGNLGFARGVDSAGNRLDDDVRGAAISVWVTKLIGQLIT